MFFKFLFELFCILRSPRQMWSWNSWLVFIDIFLYVALITFANRHASAHFLVIFVSHPISDIQRAHLSVIHFVICRGWHLPLSVFWVISVRRCCCFSSHKSSTFYIPCRSYSILCRAHVIACPNTMPRPIYSNLAKHNFVITI